MHDSGGAWSQQSPRPYTEQYRADDDDDAMLHVAVTPSRAGTELQDVVMMAVHEAEESGTYDETMKLIQ